MEEENVEEEVALQTPTDKSGIEASRESGGEEKERTSLQISGSRSHRRGSRNILRRKSNWRGPENILLLPVKETKIRKRKNSRSQVRMVSSLSRWKAIPMLCAEVLGEVRSQAKLEDSQLLINTFRQTKAGDILLELGTNLKNKKVFSSILKNI